MSQLFTFNLGTTGKSSTVGYQFYDALGASLAARSTSGVTEIGSSGVYFRSQNRPTGAVAIVWNDTDTGVWKVDDTISLARVGDEMALTESGRNSLIAAIEIELIDDITGGAFMQAIADKLVEVFDIEDLGLLTIANAVWQREERTLTSNLSVEDVRESLGMAAANLDEQLRLIKTQTSIR